MDSKDRNESKTRQREAALARRLGEALEQLNPSSAKDCPDAEVIAAYAEHSLGADESAQCENHFVACGRCRNILRVLAAASDAPLAEKEVAQLGQLISAVRAPVEIIAGAAKRPRSKAALWSTRWLAPAFGIAAVLTVWFVMRPPWRAMDRSGSPTLIAQAPQQEMPESAPLAADRVEKSAPAPEAPAAKSAPPNSYAAPSPNDQLKSKDATRDASPNESLAKSFSNEKKEAAPFAGDNKPKTLAAPTPPPAPPASLAPPASAVSSAMNSPAPMPQARAQMDSAASAANSARLPASQSGEVSGAPPQVDTTNATLAGTVSQPPTADLPLNGRNFQALNSLSLRRVTPLLLKSATGSSLWRVGNAGVIERSTDAGKTWSSQMSPAKEDWRAGAAISDTVCWLVGRNGSIARTTDGKNWQSITPPSEALPIDGKLPNWTGITAQDSQSAIITANGGAKFATTDGGKTWQRQ
jgi:hypothetical protein